MAIGRRSTPHRVDDDGDVDKRAARERRRQELALDDALENTFPASDPVSIEQLTPPGADRNNFDK